MKSNIERMLAEQQALLDKMFMENEELMKENHQGFEAECSAEFSSAEEEF